MATKKKTAVSKTQTSTGSSVALPLAEWKSLFELMGKHQMAEIEWESGSSKLKVRSQSAPALAPVYHAPPLVAQPIAPLASAPLPAPVASATTSSAVSAASAPAVAPANHKKVLSPFVGTFYRKPSPDASAYVSEGQSVKPGDTLCIIEAMKLMNEIEAEFPGKVLSILVENGQPVEFGEPLFVIET
ncbi:MAG: hypothetical protein RJB38_1696 [Pseudomonadota bacterium]